MFSLTRNVRRSRTHDLDATLSVEIDRLDFRSALASNLNEVGVHSARRSTWHSDLTNILDELEAHGCWKRQFYAS